MSRLPLRRHARLILGALLATSALTVGLQAKATTVLDPAGDFLSTYTGPQNGDLDVLSVTALRDGTDVTLSATLNGAVGTTAGGVYVWGVDRGAGSQLLLAGTPPVGAGVVFDAVVVLSNTGGGMVIDINGAGAGPPIALGSGAVTISGDTITAIVPFADLPSNGFSTANFEYNLWPRSGLATNVQIADFAPNASDFFASVPEPAAWGLMILGLSATGVLLRRRRAQGVSLRAA